MNPSPNIKKPLTQTDQKSEDELVTQHQQGPDAWEYMHGEGVVKLLISICERKLAPSQMADAHPGYGPNELLSDVVWRLRNSQCPAMDAFINLFKESAWCRLIEIHRACERKREHFHTSAVLEVEVGDADSFANLDFQSAWERSKDWENRLFCREIIEILSALPVKAVERPVLEAILEEAASGHRVPDQEIAEGAGITANRVCKIRSRLRDKLASMLARYAGKEMPEICPGQKKSGERAGNLKKTGTFSGSRPFR